MRGSFLRHVRFLAVVLVAVMMPLFAATTAFAAFEGGHHQAHHTWYVTVGVQTADGAFSGMIFTPHDVFVKQGDTIVWTVGAKEIHTVTFGNPPADPDAGKEGSEPESANPVTNAFEEAIEQFATPAGGHSFTGAGYYNSGLMTTSGAASGFSPTLLHYSLTINAPVGTYTFYCLVHGPMMSQVVHVIPRWKDYPFTQHQYDEQAFRLRARVFAQGRAELARTLDDLPRNVVYAGPKVTIGQADVMRFIRTNTTIKVGHTVKFINVSGDPHTVTIGSEAAIPAGGLLRSVNGTVLPFGPATINVGLHDSASSGVLGFVPNLPTSVTFRFTQPGVYHYYCVFHDYEGMVGTITVTK